MNRRWLNGLVALALVAGAGPGLAQVKAKVKVRTGEQPWEMELLRREGGGMVIMREAGKPAEVGLPGSEIEWIEFALDWENRNVYEQVADGQFQQAAAILAGVLEPTYPYLGLKTNLAEPMSLLLHALYWDQQYREVVVTSHLLEVISEPSARTQARLYRALALLGEWNLPGAEAELQKVGAVARPDQLAAMYHYALARVQLHRTDWLAAQENAARVVAFYPRDWLWTVPALLVSAEAYGKVTAYGTAEQILQEIQTMAPRGYWNEQAKTVQRELRKNREAEEKKPQPEATE